MATTIRQSLIQMTRAEAVQIQEMARGDTRIEVAVSDLLVLEGPHGEKIPSPNVDVVIRVAEGARPEILSQMIDFMDRVCSTQDPSARRALRFSEDCHDVYDLLVNSMPSTSSDGIESIHSHLYRNVVLPGEDGGDAVAELAKDARFGVNTYPAGSQVFFGRFKDGPLIPYAIIVSRDTIIKPLYNESEAIKIPAYELVLFTRRPLVGGDERYNVEATDF